MFSLIRTVIQLPSSAIFSVSVVKCVQHRLPNIMSKLSKLKFNFSTALELLFCKDLMVNVENSSVRTFTLLLKHVTLTRCGQLVLGNTLNKIFSPFVFKNVFLKTK